MAQFQLSASEAELIKEALAMVEIPWQEAGRGYEPLQSIRDRIGELSFKTQTCKNCNKVFETENPRKTTCSNACRKALSRSQHSTHDPYSGNFEGIDPSFVPHLVRLQELATPQRIAAIQREVGRAKHLLTWEKAARKYFFWGVDEIGMAYPGKRITVKLVRELRKLFPAAARLPLSTTFKVAEGILWGAILRLSQMEGEPPPDPKVFLAWIHYAEVESQVRLQEASAAWNQQYIKKWLQEINSADPNTNARNLLGLPLDSRLTKKAINSAWKKAAKQHHPDQGGDTEMMTRLNQAKDYLMLSVA